MRNFKAEPTADKVGLVHFIAAFGGTARAQPIEVKMFVGEPLAKRDGRWLVPRFQKTPAAWFER